MLAMSMVSGHPGPLQLNSWCQAFRRSGCAVHECLVAGEVRTRCNRLGVKTGGLIPNSSTAALLHGFTTVCFQMSFFDEDERSDWVSTT